MKNPKIEQISVEHSLGEFYLMLAFAMEVLFKLCNKSAQYIYIYINQLVFMPVKDGLIYIYIYTVRFYYTNQTTPPWQRQASNKIRPESVQQRSIQFSDSSSPYTIETSFDRLQMSERTPFNYTTPSRQQPVPRNLFPKSRQNSETDQVGMAEIKEIMQQILQEMKEQNREMKEIMMKIMAKQEQK